MPRGDRTGPAGLGPRTGRAAGYCSGSETPGFANAGSGFGRGLGRGRGFGMGGGFGRGFGRGFGFKRFGFMPQQQQPAINEPEYLEQELKSIEQEEKILLQEKEEIKKRMKGLKKDG